MIRSAGRRTLALRRDERGLSTVEYIIVLVVVVCIAIGAWHTFGQRVRSALVSADGISGTLESATESAASSASDSTGATSAEGSTTPRARSAGSPALAAAHLVENAPNAASSEASPAAAARSDAPQPGLLERARNFVTESVPAQMALGVATGTIQSIVPGLFLAGSPMPRSRAFEAGRGIAQVVTGGVQVATGLGMIGGGGAAAGGGGLAATVTGGTTLVLSAAGVAVAAQGVYVAGQGLANAGAGVRTLANAVSMSGNEGGGSGGGSPPAPKEPAWTAHGNKHVASPRAPWSKVVSDTKTGPAKYLPGTKVEALEREVWANGRPVTNGKPWKVMEFPEEVGASGGQTSRWVRVEESAGTIHGHPITEAEYLRLTRAK